MTCKVKFERSIEGTRNGVNGGLDGLSERLTKILRISPPGTENKIYWHRSPIGRWQ